ncbi:MULTISPECIES: hypothetical protein [unclassified Microcoleus]|uniref:hypothetical protein n=1 Tax=unclassified Microcoleus TaxID=2642155 RepID=UPI002FD25986
MKGFTFEQRLKIRDYFDDPTYPQPHGEVMATQLLAAMIASGRYGVDQYDDLVELAMNLTGHLVTRFDAQMCELRELRDDSNPKPSASENDLNSSSNSEADFDPIPF